jgi:signal transduction histidine kinase
MSDLRGLRELARRHPWVVDALFPALVLALGPHTSVLSGVISAALCLPLIVRRRYPVAVFGVLAAVAFVQWLADIRVSADVALLVGFYTVAAYRSWRWTAAATAVLEFGVLLASLRWAPGLLDSMIFLSAMVVAAGVLGVNMRTRRAYLASLEERAVRLEAERDQQARLAAAAERARISREMHDVVAHSLSVMIALADGAGYAPDRAGEAMASVSATGRTALAEMRRLLGILRAPDESELHPQPGVGELDELVEKIRAAGLPVTLVLDGDPSPVPAGAQLTVYRLVQESLTNTLKHAGPGASAQVRLSFTPYAVCVDVSDTGLSAKAGHGHGIAGMRERAAIYGGELSAGPDPAGGWRVRALLTLDSA